MDTNPTPENKAQWLFRLGIYGLDYGVQDYSYI